jgi:hypothetical protein
MKIVTMFILAIIVLGISIYSTTTRRTVDASSGLLSASYVSILDSHFPVISTSNISSIN